MSQNTKQFLANDSVDSDKIQLANNDTLRALNAAGTAEVAIVKVDTTDRIVFPSIPQVASDPLVDNDLARKKYVDDSVSGVVAGDSYNYSPKP